MLRVGLTGGIGSGKSTVVKMFEELGIPVFVADDAAKRLMVSSKKIRDGLVHLFGNEVYVAGELNKPFLADKIFNNKELLEKVNALVHPSVRHSFKIWAAKQYSPYVIQESAILFENQLDTYFDKIILVTAPVEVRINRVMQRDNCSREAVLARMNNQWKDERKRKLSHFIIENHHLEETKFQVTTIHKLLLNTSRTI